MKLEELEIQNFRGIEHLKLDFRDELGRIPQRIPIVGPNTSGKTSILDAITLCLMPLTGAVRYREGLNLSPASIVRRGADYAEVTCMLRFSEEEANVASELSSRFKTPIPGLHEHSHAELRWRYPKTGMTQGMHPTEKHTGVYSGDLSLAGGFLRARALIEANMYLPDITPRYLENASGIFMFDQHRARFSRYQPYATKSSTVDDEDETTATIETTEQPPFLINPRQVLLDLAARAQAPQDEGATEREDFNRLCELFAKVCHPHKIIGPRNTEQGLDIEFEGDRGPYRYDGLSSGQEMLLMLLLQFATDRIHRSIVLIDELELHLHPLWQERLYHSLDRLGIENQLFFTTHSTHLRDLISDDVCYCTGELGERAFVKKEAF